MGVLRRALPGLLLALAVGLLATGLGRLMPVPGGPVIALLLGVVVAAVRPPGASLRPGVSLAGSRVLQASIVVLGATLSLRAVADVGVRSLPVMLGSLVVVLLAGQLLGRALGVDRDLRTLITVGTGICGASAIATTASIIRPKPADTSYALSTIVLFNLVALLGFPFVGRALGLSGEGFGVWAGTAVNDTSSVVAVSTVYGAGAVGTAVVVKLVRTLALVPVGVGLAVLRSRGTGDGSPVPWRRFVPAFIPLFVLAVLARSLGVVPDDWSEELTSTAGFLVTVALGAIGLTTSVRAVLATGARPLLLGGGLWLLLAGTSLSLQGLTGLL